MKVGTENFAIKAENVYVHTSILIEFTKEKCRAENLCCTPVI